LIWVRREANYFLKNRKNCLTAKAKHPAVILPPDAAAPDPWRPEDFAANGRLTGDLVSPAARVRRLRARSSISMRRPVADVDYQA
jgi:hypothetical protein